VGAVVRCPTCAGQVQVPAKSTEAEGLAGEADIAQPVFERNDFEDLFNAPGAAAPSGAFTSATTAASSPEGSWGTHAEPAFDVERLHPPTLVSAADPPPREPTPREGIVLSPKLATALTVAAIVLLALAFGAGMLVDRLVLKS
jgi:hypothetical protein